MNTDLSPSSSDGSGALGRASTTPKSTFFLLGMGALLIVVLVLARLSAYGIWDPWELGIADAARRLGEGQAVDVVNLPLRLVSASFAAFGAREWAGRLPMALSGLLLLLTTGVWTARFTDRRTGVYATLVLASTPFFLLHSREMVGATPAFLGSALVMLGASAAAFGRATDAGSRAQGRAASSTLETCAWLGLALIGALIGTFSGGVLVNVAPPLAAVALLLCLLGGARGTEGAQRNARWLLLAAAVFTLAMVIRAISRHAAEPTLWIGSAPVDGSVVTHERVVEHLFHGLAPWSAILPVALASALRAMSGSSAGLSGARAEPDAPASGSSAQAHVSLGGESGGAALAGLCLLWATLAYAAQSIVLSSFSPSAFTAPGALAVAVALWLRQREHDERDDLPELIVCLLLLGLIIRDFALYPQSPFGALEIGEAKTPDIFNPKRAWALVLSAFGAALVLTRMPGKYADKLDPRAPYRGLLRLWHAGKAQRAWLVVFGLLALGLLIFGALAFAAPRALRLTSLGTRIGRLLFFVPLLLPLLVAGAQALHHYSARLHRLRSALPLGAALLVGAYTSQVFLPQLSAHLSPRPVFDAYNKLAKPGEPLAQHRVEGRAAAYYAKGDVRDIVGQPELVDFLASGSRRWVALPSELLAEVDVAFRRRTGRHLFVPKLDNAKIMLAANQALPGKEDRNPLTRFVQRNVPSVQNTVHADFEGKIELIGYDLELPRGTSVGPGQSFHITWIWRAKQSALGSYQVFLHLDADNQRINGDHDPVDGKYPVRLWDQGDVIIDRQEISVPATSPAGVYTLYVGLFRGESRLKVTEGPRDDADRVKAGTIRVQ
jgi:hypothetical protein